MTFFVRKVVKLHVLVRFSVCRLASGFVDKAPSVCACKGLKLTFLFLLKVVPAVFLLIL